MHLLNQLNYYWRLEWLKMRHSVAFKVMLAMYVIALPGAVLSVRNIEFDKVLEKGYFLMFPTVWGFLGYVGNWMSFFMLGFIVLLMVTQEYSNRTLRQNVINGMTRQGIWTSKVLFSLSLALAATLYYILCSLITGYLFTNTVYASRVAVGYQTSLMYFVMCLGYMSLAMMVAFLIRRSGLSIFLYFGYIMFLEPILRYALHFQFFKNRGMLFWPANVMEELTPIPHPKMLDGFSSMGDIKLFITPTEAIGFACVYIVLFLAASWWRVLRSDM